MRLKGILYKMLYVPFRCYVAGRGVQHTHTHTQRGQKLTATWPQREEARGPRQPACFLRPKREPIPKLLHAEV